MFPFNYEVRAERERGNDFADLRGSQLSAAEPQADLTQNGKVGGTGCSSTGENRAAPLRRGGCTKVSGDGLS